MDGIRYYDIRHVCGQSTHIEIDNGVIESAGTSFFDHAVIRALSTKGWGILTVGNFGGTPEKERERLIRDAARIAAITAQEVSLADATRGIRGIPPMHEDPREVSIGEKAEIMLSIERAARIEEIVNTRANYTERFEEVTFHDSSGASEQ